MLLLFVEDDAVLALRLGGHHRGLGAGGELARVHRVLGAACEADRHGDGADGRHLDLAGTRDDALRDANGVGAVARAHDHAELLAAEAADDVLRADGRAQRLGELLQHLVADAVAVDVVDPLEVVDVEHEDGDGAMRAARLLQRVQQPLVERAVVEEAGQRVGLRLMLEPRADLRVVERERGGVGEALRELELGLAEHRLLAEPVDVEHALDLGAGDERDRDERLGIDRRARHDADPRIEVRLLTSAASRRLATQPVTPSSKPMRARMISSAYSSRMIIGTSRPCASSAS